MRTQATVAMQMTAIARSRRPKERDVVLPSLLPDFERFEGRFADVASSLLASG